MSAFGTVLAYSRHKGALKTRSAGLQIQFLILHEQSHQVVTGTATARIDA